MACMASSDAWLEMLCNLLTCAFCSGGGASAPHAELASRLSANTAERASWPVRKSVAKMSSDAISFNGTDEMYVNLEVLSKFIRWRYAASNFKKVGFTC